eukprot:3723797-Rhodomonas_salina.1
MEAGVGCRREGAGRAPAAGGAGGGGGRGRQRGSLSCAAPRRSRRVLRAPLPLSPVRGAGSGHLARGCGCGAA